MDSIFALFSEPTWWFEKLVMPLIVISLFKWLGSRLLRVAKRFLSSQVKRLRLNYLRKLKRQRQSEYDVQYATVRAGAYYTVFLLTLVAYYFSLVLFPAFGYAKPLVTTLLLIPTLAFETAWLISENFARSLFRARQRLLKNSLLRGV